MSTASFSPEVMPTNVASASNVFYYLLVPTIVLWYVYWQLSRRQMYKIAEKLPGPKGYPFIGNALLFTGTHHGKGVSILIDYVCGFV